MPPVHPGTIIKEIYLEPLGVTISQLGDILGVARRTISLIINGHSGVSVEMSLRLSKAFNTTPELWLNMQRDYDLWYAEKKIVLSKIRNIIPPRKFTCPFCMTSKIFLQIPHCYYAIFADSCAPNLIKYFSNKR